MKKPERKPKVKKHENAGKKAAGKKCYSISETVTGGLSMGARKIVIRSDSGEFLGCDRDFVYR